MMLTEDTMRKLHEMRLTVMARTLREQLQDSAYNDMPFEDRVSLLVDREGNQFFHDAHQASYTHASR